VHGIEGGDEKKKEREREKKKEREREREERKYSDERHGEMENDVIPMSS